MRQGDVLLRTLKENSTVARPKRGTEHHFCICNGLLSSAGYNPDKEESLYTVGTNAYRVDNIVWENTSGRTAGQGYYTHAEPTDFMNSG